MSGNSSPKLTCPACFAREIDPVFLRHDPEEGGEYYCQHCGYTAKTRGEVENFLNVFVLLRHGIDRQDL